MLKSRLARTAACGIVAFFLLTAISQPSAASPLADPAAAYCTATGGVVYDRQATADTNGGPTFPLAFTRPFCQYTSAKDGSRIHVLLDTLFTNQPTLAALAYYAKVPMTGKCTGNPASCYCSQLGGSDLFGGINASGGGWVNNNSTDQVLEACIFPDMSSIDSWGLAYNTNGDIRGINLSYVLRYKNPN